MGLFDRFKRQAKEAVDSNRITVEDGTIEADKIIEKRKQLLLKIEESKKDKMQIIDSSESIVDADEQWDNFSEEIETNPFPKR